MRHDFQQPPPVVWEWLNDPQRRTRWMHERMWSADARTSGRTGVGSRNHCAHGKDNFTETILDWKPFDYVTSRQEGPGVLMTETVTLEELPGRGGTRLLDTISFPSRLPRLIRRPLMTFIITRVAQYKNDAIFQDLARLMAEDTGDDPADRKKDSS